MSSWSSLSKCDGYTVNTYQFFYVVIQYDKDLCQNKTLRSSRFAASGKSTSLIIYGLRSEVHCMQSAICSLQSAICSLQSANVRHRLNAYIAEFIITVRKKDGNEDYEPSSLRSLMASFGRYLKKKNYGFSIMKDAEFEQARKALQSKQKDLKQKGKGNKPNTSVALTEEEIKLLYDKELLGTSTPEALLNTIWFNNTIHFGLRGCKKH